jgi:hypothetical protein
VEKPQPSASNSPCWACDAAALSVETGATRKAGKARSGATAAAPSIYPSASGDSEAGRRAGIKVTLGGTLLGMSNSQAPSSLKRADTHDTGEPPPRKADKAISGVSVWPPGSGACLQLGARHVGKGGGCLSVCRSGIGLCVGLGMVGRRGAFGPGLCLFTSVCLSGCAAATSRRSWCPVQITWVIRSVGWVASRFWPLEALMHLLVLLRRGGLKTA